MKKYKTVFNESSNSAPDSLKIGKTYDLNDGGTVTISDFYVVDIVRHPKVIVGYNWVSPKNQKGSDIQELNSFLKSYFGV